jgi:hypothetical protein
MTTLEFIPVPIRATPTEVDVLTIDQKSSPYITQSAPPEKQPNEVVQVSKENKIYKIVGISILIGLAIYVFTSNGK